MNNTANTIVQYLQYLWKRKWLILLVTVLFAGIGYVYEKTVYTQMYRGSSYIFTGNADNDRLSKKEFIEGQLKDSLPEEYHAKLDVTVPTDYQILITLDGINSKDVKENLELISEHYVELLEERYTNQKKELLDQQDATKKNIVVLEEQEEALVRNITLRLERQNPILAEEVTSILEDPGAELLDNEDPVLEKLLNNLESIMKKVDKYYKQEKKLLEWEPPSVENVTVVPIFNKPFLNPLTAAALGFQLMIVFLVLYKLFKDLLKTDRKREAKS
jgi:LPS O-antigen subunit length determinant protein (WzzB/FepE family)